MTQENVEPRPGQSEVETFRISVNFDADMPGFAGCIGNYHNAALTFSDVEFTAGAAEVNGTTVDFHGTEADLAAASVVGQILLLPPEGYVLGQFRVGERESHSPGTFAGLEGAPDFDLDNLALEMGTEALFALELENWSPESVPELAGARLVLTGTATVTSVDARGGSFTLEWQGSIYASPSFRRGDANDSGSVDLSDAVFILHHLFGGGRQPGCLEAADTDDDGRLDISDAIGTLNYLFLGMPPPADPGPFECGPHPLSSRFYLGCEQYASC